MKPQSPASLVRSALSLIVACSLIGCGPAPKEILTVDLGGGVSMEFVLVHPGSFQMGSDATKPFGDPDNPVHKVTLTKPFYLGKYLVTQEQWQTVMTANPSVTKGARNPVDSVSWDDCQDFLTKLNLKVPGLGSRFPTEAEWEYACRAGTRTEYSFGDSWEALDEYGWSKSNSGGTTHPVGEKKPNAWGLYDMHGNLLEWCADWSDSYTANDQTDPIGPPSGSMRVSRGGSWVYDAFTATSAYRFAALPNRYTDYRYWGLRCALNVGKSR